MTLNFTACYAGLASGLFGVGVCSLLNMIINAMYRVMLAN